MAAHLGFAGGQPRFDGGWWVESVPSHWGKSWQDVGSVQMGSHLVPFVQPSCLQVSYSHTMKTKQHTITQVTINEEEMLIDQKKGYSTVTFKSCLWWKGYILDVRSWTAHHWSSRYGSESRIPRYGYHWCKKNANGFKKVMLVIWMEVLTGYFWLNFVSLNLSVVPLYKICIHSSMLRPSSAREGESNIKTCGGTKYSLVTVWIILFFFTIKNTLNTDSSDHSTHFPCLLNHPRCLQAQRSQ